MNDHNQITVIELPCGVTVQVSGDNDTTKETIEAVSAHIRAYVKGGGKGDDPEPPQWMNELGEPQPSIPME